jgi:hypothetical protein
VAESRRRFGDKEPVVHRVIHRDGGWKKFKPEGLLETEGLSVRSVALFVRGAHADNHAVCGK